MRSNGCRLDRACKMPPAALPGATRRREARGQGGGLRPSSCPHSLRLGRSEGIKRLSRHKRCPPTGYPLYSTVRLTPSPLENPDGGRPHRRPVAAFSRRGPACPLSYLLKTRCRPVSGRSRAAGGKLRFSFDGWPTTSRRRGVSTVFHQKRAADRAAVRYENRSHIVSVLRIISVLIRFTLIRYERSNDHGTSGHHF